MATFFNYKLKNGDKYWGFETYLGKDPRTGKDIRTKRRRFKTKAEAQNALNKLLVEYKEKKNFISMSQRLKSYMSYGQITIE